MLLYLKLFIILLFFTLELFAEEKKASVILLIEETFNFVEIPSKKGGGWVDIRNHIGNTPLHYAPFAENILTSEEWLAEVGVDAINAQNNLGDTPLHMAAARGDLEFALLLLERGADPNIQNKRGETALHHAILKIINLPRVRGGEVTGASSSYDPALEIVKTLLDYEADPNIQNKRGETSLHYAGWKKNITVIRLLMEKGARDIPDHRGQLPLGNTLHKLPKHGPCWF